jgi:hypothetical protein
VILRQEIAVTPKQTSTMSQFDLITVHSWPADANIKIVTIVQLDQSAPWYTYVWFENQLEITR